MNAIETARELGKAIQADERFIRYAKARLANDDDEALQESIARFNALRAETDDAAGEEADSAVLKERKEKLRAVYSEIMSSPAMVEYNTAKAALDKMVNEVNVILSKSIEGEDPETIDPSIGCTGSCATCGGCG